MTYSIAARDPGTGQLGVAVQSHYFSVGPIVPWVRAGVGAVATQSIALVDYGPKGLDLMADGRSALVALTALINEDDASDVRQVAMVDAQGRVAAHTGDKCIAYANHQIGDGYTVQANMMANDSVCSAMAAAYEGATGELAERLLAALDAAQAAGGDIRGQQSAAIVVARGEPSARWWADTLIDLRVEDHPRPLVELRRLLQLRRAYDMCDRGDALLAAADMEMAMAAYEGAMKLAPGVVELRFWAAVAMFNSGRETEALEHFRTVFAAEPAWRDMVARLAQVGLFSDDPRVISQVQNVDT